jgi:hypothetical protein
MCSPPGSKSSVGSKAGALSCPGAGSVSVLGSSPGGLSSTTMPLQPGVGSSAAPALTHHGDTGVAAQDDPGEGGQVSIRLSCLLPTPPIRRRRSY